MSHLEEAVIRRYSGPRILMTGLVIAGAGVAPLLLYVAFGPKDGNPIGLGLACRGRGSDRRADRRRRAHQDARPVPGRPRLLIVFRMLGALLALYTLYATASGQVHAKSGPSGRTVSRRDSPEYFWIVIVIYAALSVALLTVF